MNKRQAMIDALGATIATFAVQIKNYTRGLPRALDDKPEPSDRITYISSWPIITSFLPYPPPPFDTSALGLSTLLAISVPESAGSQHQIKYSEGAVSRNLTLPSPGAWQFSGPDAAIYRIANDALRFATRPDYEAPEEADGDNRYQVTLQQGDNR